MDPYSLDLNVDEMKEENHLTSAVAFVEGGIQEACDDACAICLESFSESDPSTGTSCKHEFHLQCILEWCQRSSNCPMCWQAISLKDTASQELLEAVERERSFRLNPARNATIFHHPTLGNFELQHLPVGINDMELEERIIQHLAAAAAMGRTHHVSRRGSRSRSSAQEHPDFLVFSTHASPSDRAGRPPPAGAQLMSRTSATDDLSFQSRAIGRDPSHIHNNQLFGSSSGSVMSANRQGISYDNSSLDQDGAGPSEIQSSSESWKSRFNSMSMKYKESIAKSARGWKERLFSRSTSMADIGSEVKREVNAGIASVSRMIERLDTRDNTGTEHVLEENNNLGSSVNDQRNLDNIDGHSLIPVNNSSNAACPAGSVSS